jgi:hypothetical protein
MDAFHALTSEVDVFTQYGEVLGRLFESYTVDGRPQRAADGRPGSDPHFFLDLHGFLELARDRGMCPGLLSKTEASEVFKAVFLDSKGGSLEQESQTLWGRSVVRRGIPFVGFLECLRRCALMLFTGKDWNGLYPNIGDKARLLLFWMDQEGQLFVGNSGVLMNQLKAQPPRGSHRRGAAAAAAAAAAADGRAPRRGGALPSTGEVAYLNAPSAGASPSSGGRGGGGDADAGWGGGSATNGAPNYTGAGLAKWNVARDRLGHRAATDELSFSMVSLGGGGVAGDRRVQLLPHLESMDVELLTIFQHYTKTYVGASSPRMSPRKGFGGGGIFGSDARGVVEDASSDTLSATKFYKFAREFALIDERLTHGDIDIIFKKVTGSGVRGQVAVAASVSQARETQMSFGEFYVALAEVGHRKYSRSAAERLAPQEDGGDERNYGGGKAGAEAGDTAAALLHRLLLDDILPMLAKFFTEKTGPWASSSSSSSSSSTSLSFVSSGGGDALRAGRTLDFSTTAQEKNAAAAWQKRWEELRLIEQQLQHPHVIYAFQQQQPPVGVASSLESSLLARLPQGNAQGSPRGSPRGSLRGSSRGSPRGGRVTASQGPHRVGGHGGGLAVTISEHHEHGAPVDHHDAYPTSLATTMRTSTPGGAEGGKPTWLKSIRTSPKLPKRHIPGGGGTPRGAVYADAILGGMDVDSVLQQSHAGGETKKGGRTPGGRTPGRRRGGSSSGNDTGALSEVGAVGAQIARDLAEAMARLESKISSQGGDDDGFAYGVEGDEGAAGGGGYKGVFSGASSPAGGEAGGGGDDDGYAEQKTSFSGAGGISTGDWIRSLHDSSPAREGGSPMFERTVNATTTPSAAASAAAAAATPGSVKPNRAMLAQLEQLCATMDALKSAVVEPTREARGGDSGEGGGERGEEERGGTDATEVGDAANKDRVSSSKPDGIGSGGVSQRIQALEVGSPAASAASASPGGQQAKKKMSVRDRIRQGVESNTFARALFQDADKGGNGTLTKTEIRKYFTTHPIEKSHILGPDFTWSAFFLSMDTDGGAQFDIDQFSDAVSKVYHENLYTEGADAAEDLRVALRGRGEAAPPADASVDETTGGLARGQGEGEASSAAAAAAVGPSSSSSSPSKGLHDSAAIRALVANVQDQIEGMKKQMVLNEQADEQAAAAMGAATGGGRASGGGVGVHGASGSVSGAIHVHMSRTGSIDVRTGDELVHLSQPSPSMGGRGQQGGADGSGVNGGGLDVTVTPPRGGALASPNASTVRQGGGEGRVVINMEEESTFGRIPAPRIGWGDVLRGGVGGTEPQPGGGGVLNTYLGTVDPTEPGGAVGGSTLQGGEGGAGPSSPATFLFPSPVPQGQNSRINSYFRTQPLETDRVAGGGEPAGAIQVRA